MRIETIADAGALAVRAADHLCDVVRKRPGAIFGLPTGATPIAMYREIERRVWAGDVSFARASAYAIDEFAGVPWSTAGTNSMYFRERLRIPWPLHLPDPLAADPDAEIRAHAERIRASGGFDLCVLGVGVNGHIAFNEPGSMRDSPARVVDLTVASREAHALTFGSLDAVPGRGMTLGVADLLEARSIVALAAGASKTGIVKEAIEGAETSDVPASWLQSHTDVTWLLDEVAAAALRTRP